MNEEEIIYKTLELVKDKFKDKVDKNGKPYIWHLVRVALNQDTFDGTIVALLHDIFEDTDTTDGEIFDLIDLPNYLMEDLMYLTREDEPYSEYIKNINNHNGIARKVKIADLKDNLLEERKPSESLKERYLKALELLEKSDTNN